MVVEWVILTLTNESLAGARQSTVARELNVHRSVIHRLWNHYQRDQNASRRRESGRRRITTTADDRYLLRCARRRRTLTARRLASQLSAAAGRPMSLQTESRRLHEGGLFARRPVACVSLSPAHVRARLHWAREHHSWIPEHWGHALFMDESLFNIQSDSRREMIWREPGTRYRAPNIVERDHWWRVSCLGRDSNERPYRPLRVRWGFRHSCPISRRNPTPSCTAFYRCNGY
ncbi:hypothetical protein AVEN_55271-1 [Araneus ventricosus]|uniref:Transposase Tc1-like domain-containing protein n=1 Tax=Araneus ventricosus TaxID=182803 RepID=A0A4Y2D8W1_ARAVE|nr:hypothetical protein AVEN_55271-1 [Araneus ventricosus]